MAAIFNPTLVNGFILGWSVAWPLGPINAEMIQRGLLPHSAGGGFWSPMARRAGCYSGRDGGSDASLCHQVGASAALTTK
jgi:hypothetical protein